MKKGFTLIELLVVISIMAILALIGFAVFRNAQGSARDARRRVDVDAIAHAYEQQYPRDGGYSALTGTEFVSGKVPIPPEGGNYYKNVTDTDFTVCAILEGGPASCTGSGAGCYCKVSLQSRP